MSQNRNTDLNLGHQTTGAQSEKSETAGTGAGAAMKSEPADTTQNVLSDDKPSSTSAMTDDEKKESPPGAFAPFRYFINSKLRNAAGVTVSHGGEVWNVLELTIEGQLRLARAGATDPEEVNFSLVPLDERYIAGLFAQIF